MLSPSPCSRAVAATLTARGRARVWRGLALAAFCLTTACAGRQGAQMQAPETTQASNATPAAPAASVPPAPRPDAAVDLDALPVGVDIPVTLSGATITSDVTKTPCLYSEWVSGEKSGGEWSSFRSGASSGANLNVHTPHGVVTLLPVKLRLHLAPAWTGRHDADDVAEYRLEAGPTYYARVQIERYDLPPDGPGAAPTEQQTRVLALAETPWLAGAAPQPLTPRGRQHTY